MDRKQERARIWEPGRRSTPRDGALARFVFDYNEDFPSLPRGSWFAGWRRTGGYPRMFENFTRRHHLDHVETDLQYEYVPPTLRCDLFKLVRKHCSEDQESATIHEYCVYRGASIAVNSDYYRLYAADDIMEYYSPDLFVDLLLKSEWHEVLSIVEFLINEGPLSRKEVNKLFEYHSVGYEVDRTAAGDERVVVKYIALIADNDRLLSSDIPFAPVIEAVNAAKQALIDPKNIDVASSVAWSVVAVEAYLRGWLEEKGLKASTLGGAVKTLRKHSLCPPHIVQSLDHFYIYRNRTENVGHGAPKFADITREDALLCNEMAVSYINYFHRKGTNARQCAPVSCPTSADL